MQVKKNAKCRACGAGEFDVVIDLGQQPLVNSLIPKEGLEESDPTFPLVVNQCKKCGLVQITEIIDAHEIYKNVDYLYFSSDMPGLRDYFSEYAEDVRARFLNEGDFVAEMGSNDGIMLKLFQEKGHTVLGIDPATNVVIRALKRGVPTLPLFFCENIAKKIVREWGQAKAFVANNCIAHLDDLGDVLRGIAAIVRYDGVFVLECNYWGGMVKNTNYSLIYHDHYSYFSLKNWEEIAPKFGLRAFDAWVTPAQGGTLRLFLCKDNRSETDRLQALRKEEIDTKLNTYETSLMYRRNVEAETRSIRETCEKIKKDGGTIAGYGAAAKGFTILQCSKIGKEFIDYFVDDSPAKQGWFTPVDHIPIISRKDAESRLPDYFFILAPNYAKVIMEKEAAYRSKGGKFIVPVGKCSIQ